MAKTWVLVGLALVAVLVLTLVVLTAHPREVYNCGAGGMDAQGNCVKMVGP